MASTQEWAEELWRRPAGQPAEAGCVFCGASRMLVTATAAVGRSMSHRCTRCGETYWLGNERLAPREQLFRRVWVHAQGLYGLWANATHDEVRNIARLRLLAYARRHGLSMDRITGSRDERGEVDVAAVLDALAPKGLLAAPRAPSAYGPMVEPASPSDEYGEMLHKYATRYAREFEAQYTRELAQYTREFAVKP